jgi:hypothetical protein
MNIHIVILALLLTTIATSEYVNDYSSIPLGPHRATPTHL